MKKKRPIEEKRINQELLLEIFIEIDNFITTLNKIKNNANNNDIKKLALSILLFLSEKQILERLNLLRVEGHIEFIKLVGKKKMWSRLEKIEETMPEYYKVKYSLTKEEMEQEILKAIK